MALISEPLLSEEQLLFQAQLGVHLTDPQAKIFAYACRRRRVRLSDAKMVTSLPGPDAQGVLDQLVTQVLLARGGAGEALYYSLADHLIGRYATGAKSDQAVGPEPRLVTDQPPKAAESPENGEEEAAKATGEGPPSTALKELSATQWKIVLHCEAPRSTADIMEHVGVTHRSFFRRKHLEPLIKAGVLQMKHPDNPNHPEQAYVLSETGVKLKALRPPERERDPDT